MKTPRMRQKDTITIYAVDTVQMRGPGGRTHEVSVKILSENV